MIQHVIECLEKVDRVKEIIVATSVHTPKTTEYIKKRGYRVIVTPGKGYVNDLRYVITKIPKRDTLLVINADLPLVKPKTINMIIDIYEKSDKPALTVVVPRSIYKKYGLIPPPYNTEQIPIGLNLLKAVNKKQDEKKLELPLLELALNINTPEDLEFLKKFGGFNGGKNKN